MVSAKMRNHNGRKCEQSEVSRGSCYLNLVGCRRELPFYNMVFSATMPPTLGKGTGHSSIGCLG